MIDPGARYQPAMGGMGDQDPFDRPAAGLHQADRILRRITKSVCSHEQLTPCGAATGRRQAIPKQGSSCPLGWFSSGSYCVQSR